MRSLKRPTSGEIGMYRKAPFYFSRWSLVASRWSFAIKTRIRL